MSVRPGDARPRLDSGTSAQSLPRSFWTFVGLSGAFPDCPGLSGTVQIFRWGMHEPFFSKSDRCGDRAGPFVLNRGPFLAIVPCGGGFVFLSGKPKTCPMPTDPRVVCESIAHFARRGFRLLIRLDFSTCSTDFLRPPSSSFSPVPVVTRFRWLGGLLALRGCPHRGVRGDSVTSRKTQPGAAR